MRAAVLALALAACAHAPEARIGAAVPIFTPQAADQCAAQPGLDWCVASRR